ncbi:MAG: biotin transporter BioY [Pseudomonadota bacterium]
MGETVLSRALIGHDGMIKKLGLVLAGSIIVAIAAQFSIGWPVPMSLQGLAVLIIGFTYGSKLASATLVTYLAYGAMGLPVFSNGRALEALAGPQSWTAGFLYGFVMMAFIAGLAADRGLTRNVLAMSLVGIVASLLLYVPGLLWPALLLGVEWADLWTKWMLPFLLGDTIKAVVAAMIVWGGWKAVTNRSA